MISRRTAPAVTSGAIVITGASTGIGKACALWMDKLGFQVFAGVRKESDGENLRRQASARLVPITLDVTDSAQIERAVQMVAAAVGDKGLVGLVNNAGVAIAGPLEYLPVEELRRQLEINVVAQIAVTQAFLPLLRQGQGRIVNMGSVSGLLAVPLLGAYSASKFALEALTDALRGELRPWGLAVSIVEPSGIKTPIWEKSLAEGDKMLEKIPAEAQQRYGAVINTVRRASQYSAKNGTPVEEVARVVEHALTAAKPKTRYLVGQQVRVQTLLRFLPDRLRDQMIARRLKG